MIYSAFRGDCKISTRFYQIAKHLWLEKYGKQKRTNSVAVDELSGSILAKENIEHGVSASELKMESFGDSKIQMERPERLSTQGVQEIFIFEKLVMY